MRRLTVPAGDVRVTARCPREAWLILTVTVACSTRRLLALRSKLRVMPVAQVRKPNTETMEVWLAAEYNYLPVRIRFIGRDGAPTGEQIVTDIRVGNE